MSSTNTITDRDLGYADILGKLSEIAEGKYVVVGIRSAAGGQDTGNGFNLASLAATHEFGSEKAGIPERSFLRSVTDARQEEIGARAEAAVGRVLDGGDVAKELGLIGLEHAGKIQQAIADRTIGGPPNAESTIREKKSSTPLIRDGRLRQSIDSEVRKP